MMLNVSHRIHIGVQSLGHGPRYIHANSKLWPPPKITKDQGRGPLLFEALFLERVALFSQQLPGGVPLAGAARLGAPGQEVEQGLDGGSEL